MLKFHGNVKTNITREEVQYGNTGNNAQTGQSVESCIIASGIKRKVTG